MSVTILYGNDTWALHDEARTHGGSIVHQATETELMQAVGGTLFAPATAVVAYPDPRADLGRLAAVAQDSPCDVLLILERAPARKALPSGAHVRSRNLPDRKSAPTWLRSTAERYNVTLTAADVARLVEAAVADPRSVVNSFRITELTGDNVLTHPEWVSVETPWGILDQVTRGKRSAIAHILTGSAAAVPTAAFTEAALRRAWQASRTQPADIDEAARTWGAPVFQARLPWALHQTIPAGDLEPLALASIEATLDAKRGDPTPIALVLSRLCSHFTVQHRSA